MRDTGLGVRVYDREAPPPKEWVASLSLALSLSLSPSLSPRLPNPRPARGQAAHGPQSIAILVHDAGRETRIAFYDVTRMKGRFRETSDHEDEVDWHDNHGSGFGGHTIGRRRRWPRVYG